MDGVGRISRAPTVAPFRLPGWRGYAALRVRSDGRTRADHHGPRAFLELAGRRAALDLFLIAAPQRPPVDTDRGVHVVTGILPGRHGALFGHTAVPATAGGPMVALPAGSVVAPPAWTALRRSCSLLGREWSALHESL